MVGSDLYFIKTRNTGTGRVEVHAATAASGYKSASVHAATWFGTGDQNNGWFQIGRKA